MAPPDQNEVDDLPGRQPIHQVAERAAENQGERELARERVRAMAREHDDNHADRVIALVKEAQITISSNAQISLVLDGRGDRGLVRRGITRVSELLEAGVNVISAQDDVNDPYYPFGKPDQLEVAQYTAHVAQLTYPPQLETVMDMVTVNAARAMRLEGYGTEPGDRAWGTGTFLP